MSRRKVTLGGALGGAPVGKIAVAVGAVTIAGISVSSASAAAIDVLMSRTTYTAAAGATTSSPNNGITPYTYAPTLTTIADAPSVTYDAADTADTGTQWNTLQCPNGGAVDNTSGAETTTIYQQNIPLADSTGAATSVTLAVSFSENNGKTDSISQTGMTSGTNPGSDGLSANPSGLMSQSWFDNGTSEYITFTLAGLTPNQNYNLYIYGSGTNYGYGGTYTLAAVNQPAGYAAVSTDPSSSTIYRSVFDSTGINPAPEEGLSWNLLPAVADSNGDLTFNVTKDAGSGVKGSINGFQLDVGAAPIPEPASLGLIGIALAGITARRRRA